jgi:hypothetical protein
METARSFSEVAAIWRTVKGTGLYGVCIGSRAFDALVQVDTLQGLAFLCVALTEFQAHVAHDAVLLRFFTPRYLPLVTDWDTCRVALARMPFDVTLLRFKLYLEQRKRPSRRHATRTSDLVALYSPMAPSVRADCGMLRSDKKATQPVRSHILFGLATRAGGGGGGGS